MLPKNWIEIELLLVSSRILFGGKPRTLYQQLRRYVWLKHMERLPVRLARRKRDSLASSPACGDWGRTSEVGTFAPHQSTDRREKTISKLANG